MMSMLNEKEYSHLPYHLFETICINTNNLSKVASSLVTMLNDKFEKRVQVVRQKEKEKIEE